MSANTLTRTLAEQAVRENLLNRIVLFNDDVNTFDWVIESLVEVCQHTPEQAEQCAYFVHYKGRYAVKHGSYDDLVPPATALADRGLTVEIQ